MAPHIILPAEKFELRDINDVIIYNIKKTGNRSLMKHDNIEFHCSNKAGNKTYLNNINEIKYRASVKANHITIYSHPDSEALVRVGIKANRYAITYGQTNYSLRINKTGAELEDQNGKILTKANYNSLSKNIKCTNSEGKEIINYKWSKPNFSGLLWLAEKLPAEIRMIIINELLK